MLDLDQVTLVDLDVVRFLGVSEAEGVELVNCSRLGFQGAEQRGTGLAGDSWRRSSSPECDGKDKLKGENQ